MSPAGTDPVPVLYCNSWSTAHGGSSTSLLDIVAALDRRRFSPIVVCPEPGDLPARLRDLEVPVIIRRLSRFNRQEVWRFAAEVPGYLRLLASRGIRLVHGNTSASRRSLLQAVALRRIPYVQHVRNGVEKPRQQFGYRLATRIITNSNSAAVHLQADPLFQPKTMTIHNAVALEGYDGTTSHRADLLESGSPIIGFVGQIVPRKGLDTLIHAMPRILSTFPAAQLVVVGCAPSDERSYEAHCRAIAEELQVSNRVLFTGYRRDIPAWMRTFDVFALPTRSEPFGKVVIEAMAAGCPVVASRVGGIPEIITAPMLGTLIPPDDPESLAKALLHCLCNPDVAALLGSRGRAHVREHFSLGRMIGRLQDVYEMVLHARS